MNTRKNMYSTVYRFPSFFITTYVFCIELVGTNCTDCIITQNLSLLRKQEMCTGLILQRRDKHLEASATIKLAGYTVGHKSNILEHL